MSRTSATKLRVAAISVASAVLAVAAGCSSGGKPSSMTSMSATPISVANPSRNMTPAARGITANNARDLAAAQPESVLPGGARELDLTDNGNGGGSGGAQIQMLNVQSLGDMMKSMGLNPDVDKDHYVLHLKANISGTNYTFPIEISINENHTLIWIACGMGSLENQKITGDSLYSLLVGNAQLSPSYFIIDSQHWLVLQRPVTNAGITPQVLGYNIKQFVASLKAAEPLYRVFMTPPENGGGNGGGGGNDSGSDNPFK